MSHSYWTQEKILSARPRALEEVSEEGWTWRSNSIGENIVEEKNTTPESTSTIPEKEEEPSKNQLSSSTDAVLKITDSFLDGISLDQISRIQHSYWTTEKVLASIPREIIDDDESLCTWRACDLEDDGTPVLVSDSSPVDDDPALKDTTQFPLKLVGILLFTNSGTHYSGTAFLVNNSTILTAGHNIFLKGDPHKSENIAWIPGYSLTNQTGFGIFDGIADKVLTSPKWDGDSVNSSPFDYAIIHLKPNEKGQTPFDVLGGLLTIETTQPENSTDFTEVGFYKASPLQTSTGKYVGLLDNPLGTMLVKNGSLPQGASGGPWLLSGDFGKVNGLTSKGNSVKEKSPLFNEELLNFVKVNSL